MFKVDSLPPLPLWERAGVRGFFVVQITPLTLTLSHKGEREQTGAVPICLFFRTLGRTLSFFVLQLLDLGLALLLSLNCCHTRNLEPLSLRLCQS